MDFFNKKLFMKLKQLTSIFLSDRCLAYPEARAILKSVIINPKILEDSQSPTYVKLEQFIIKDLKNCDKSSKFKFILLKIKNVVLSQFNFCTGAKAKKGKAINCIIYCATQILKNKEKNLVEEGYHLNRLDEESKHSNKVSETPSKVFEVINNEGILYKDFMKSLEDLEKEAPSENPIKCLFKPQRIVLEQSYQHHQLCDKLAAISVKFQKASVSIKESWEKYLEDLKNIDLVYSDEIVRKLKTKTTLKFLKNEAPQIVVNKISELKEEDITQITKIENESFTTMEINHPPLSDSHRDRIRQAKNIFYVARDVQNNNKIVGLLEYLPEYKIIFSIARRAMYSQCKVGKLLWESFLKDRGQEKTKLYVRKSNPAVEVYKKWGFKVQNTVHNFYSQPDEDALMMQL